MGHQVKLMQTNPSRAAGAAPSPSTLRGFPRASSHFHSESPTGGGEVPEPLCKVPNGYGRDLSLLVNHRAPSLRKGQTSAGAAVPGLAVLDGLKTLSCACSPGGSCEVFQEHGYTQLFSRECWVNWVGNIPWCQGRAGAVRAPRILLESAKSAGAAIVLRSLHHG